MPLPIDLIQRQVRRWGPGLRGQCGPLLGTLWAEAVAGHFREAPWTRWWSLLRASLSSVPCGLGLHLGAERRLRVWRNVRAPSSVAVETSVRGMLLPLHLVMNRLQTSGQKHFVVAPAHLTVVLVHHQGGQRRQALGMAASNHLPEHTADPVSLARSGVETGLVLHLLGEIGVDDKPVESASGSNKDVECGTRPLIASFVDANVPLLCFAHVASSSVQLARASSIHGNGLRQTRRVTSDAGRSEIEREFERAMRDIYLRAKQEANYNATYFLHMLAEHGALDTARRLITSTTPSQGFTALWERHRLDLTVEAHVLQSRFSDLFTVDELEAAASRLAAYGYTPPAEY